MILYKKYPEALTAREIATELGIKRQQVADVLSRWHRRGFGYTKRSKVKGTKAYNYVITETGTSTMIKYKKRVDENLSLNLKIVKKEENYIGISKQGSSDGLTVEDAVKEMKKRKESRDVDR